MTYRDDRDALLARADALADELARVERERDRLRDQVAALQRSPAPVAQTTALVTALDRHELDRMVVELERAIERARAPVAWLLPVFVVFTTISTFALACGVMLAVLPVVLFGLCSVSCVFAMGSQRPARERELVETVRAAPHRVLEIIRGQSRYGTDYLQLRTTEHEVRVSGTTELFDLLVRHCPEAKLERFESE